jgi:hypothetical protein
MAGDDVRKYYVFAARAAGDILGTILVPPGVALVLKYAFHLPYTIFLALLVIALILTALVLAKKIPEYGRSFQQLNRSTSLTAGKSEDELRGPRS